MENINYVFELVKPGWYLDDNVYKNTEEKWALERLINGLQDAFLEANVALNLFMTDRNTRSSSFDRIQYESNRKSELRDEIREEILKDKPYNFQVDYEELSFQAERRFKTEQLAKGEMPEELSNKLGYIYARTFLFALDNFEKILSVLIEEKGAPQNLNNILVEFQSFFPNLRDVRNSAHHKEDRIRGLQGSNKKKEIDFKPLVNNMINAPNAKVQIGEALNGYSYGTSLANGHYAEVEVSQNSMTHLTKIMQDVFDSFQWGGGRKILP